MELNKSTHILIVGLGLLGGSYAQSLSRQGYLVHGIARRKETIDFALKHGYIKEGYIEVTKENIAWADLIIMGLYPKALVEWMETYGKFIKKGTIVTDVTGIKGYIVDKVQSILGDDPEFIAAHPMAGREKSGIEFSDESIFQGANYIITPTEKNTENGKHVCRQLGEVLGFARISYLTPDKHDEMIAFLSQLAHILAVSLMTAVSDESICDYTGDSFRDLTRIARLNDEMWSELFMLNKDALLLEMEKFETEFDKMKNFIKQDDRDGMREMMRLSTQRRALFDKRNLRKKEEEK